MPRIAPSLMCASILHLQKDIEELDRAGADFFHIDIMDGHFVPNLALNLDFVGKIKTVTQTPIDVHLMVDNPESYVRPMHELGVEYASFHMEAAKQPLRLIRTIKARGPESELRSILVGIENLPCVLEELDYILVMTVEPGFAGQRFVRAVLEKIAALRKLIDARDLEIPIEVDGNISVETARWCIDSGASILVAGTSSIFTGQQDLYSSSLEFRRRIAGESAPTNFA